MFFTGTSTTQAETELRGLDNQLWYNASTRSSRNRSTDGEDTGGEMFEVGSQKGAAGGQKSRKRRQEEHVAGGDEAKRAISSERQLSLASIQSSNVCNGLTQKFICEYCLSREKGQPCEGRLRAPNVQFCFNLFS